MGRLFWLMIFCVSVGSSSWAATGKEIFKSSCSTCHGVNNAILNAPLLHGQEPAYLMKSLKAFRSNTREDHIMNTMNSVASSLSDEDIQKVSTYLAGTDLCEVRQDIDPEADGFMDQFKAGRSLAENSRCMHCHGSFHHAAPRLYGQKKEFFSLTLKAFRDGRRKNPMMNKITAQMTDEDIENLSVFFNGMKLMRECR